MEQLWDCGCRGAACFLSFFFFFLSFNFFFTFFILFFFNFKVVPESRRPSGVPRRVCVCVCKNNRGKVVGPVLLTVIFHHFLFSTIFIFIFIIFFFFFTVPSFFTIFFYYFTLQYFYLLLLLLFFYYYYFSSSLYFHIFSPIRVTPEQNTGAPGAALFFWLCDQIKHFVRKISFSNFFFF